MTQEEQPGEGSEPGEVNPDSPGEPGSQAPQEELGEQPVEDQALLRERMEEALREKDQFRALAQRAQADLANYKRRASEEMDELRQSANERLLLRVVSIADDLDRAVSHIPQDSVAPGWLDGLVLVLRGVNQVLDSESVHKMEADGRPFDPFEHEAVHYQEAQDTEEGTVLKVLRNGYRHNNRVLRAAQVVVAKKPETIDNPEIGEEEPQ